MHLKGRYARARRHSIAQNLAKPIQRLRLSFRMHFHAALYVTDPAGNAGSLRRSKNEKAVTDALHVSIDPPLPGGHARE